MFSIFSIFSIFSLYFFLTFIKLLDLSAQMAPYETVVLFDIVSLPNSEYLLIGRFYDSVYYKVKKIIRREKERKREKKREKERKREKKREKERKREKKR